MVGADRSLIDAIAVTGTRGRPRPHPPLLPAEEAIIEEVLAALPPRSWLIVGGQRGVDTVAARRGKQNGHRIHLVVPSAPYDPESHRYADDIEVAPVGINAAHSYKIRDARMVELGVRLLAFPKTPVEEIRSGTWLTVRMARKAHKPVEIHPLRDLVLL